MQRSEELFEFCRVFVHEPCQEGKDKLVRGFVSVFEDEGGLFFGRLERDVKSNEVLLEGEVEEVVVSSVSSSLFEDAGV